jgi:hypothetical protein
MLLVGDLCIFNLDSVIFGDFDPDLQNNRAGVDSFFLLEKLTFS